LRAPKGGGSPGANGRSARPVTGPYWLIYKSANYFGAKTARGMVSRESSKMQRYPFGEQMPGGTTIRKGLV
jgi:hypothetical protein